MSSTHRIEKGRLFASALILVATGAVAAAAAEGDYNTYYGPPGPYHQPTPPYPVEMGFSQHHSSTYAEGVQRGRAAVIQARGNYALSRSQADILDEQARWLRRLNDLELTRALYARQDMWQAHRDEQARLRESRTALGLEKVAERRRTLYSEIYQLDDDQLDVTTGEISWPATFASDSFDRHRAQLNELFRTHVAYGNPQPDTARAIARCARQTKALLRRDYSRLSFDEYSDAQNFLLGLEYEAEGLVQLG